MSEKKQDEKKPEDTDKELSELLDSALADFSKEASKPAEKPKEEAAAAGEEAQPPEPEWTEDYIQQAAEQFETNIASLLGNVDGDSTTLSTEQIQASFQRMAEAAQQAMLNPGIADPVSNDFASAISQTIQGLSQGTENLQNPFSENDIMNMFSGASAPSEQNAFLPFMQGMMQSLLSKEVLYPSLKDILEKYPAWLTENDSRLSSEDKERYLKQQNLMQQVCTQLETESESDTAEMRKTRFDRVLELMQKLQDYGQPPTEIVADVGPTVPFDQQGNPEQCSIM